MIIVTLSFCYFHMGCSLYDVVEKALRSQDIERNKRREKDFHFSWPSQDIWDKFYGTATIDTVVSTNRTVTENNNVFIHSVLFENFNQQGAIYISKPTQNTKVLVSTCSFFKSFSTGDGGSIYLALPYPKGDGSCVQYKVCSYGSKTPLSSGVGSHSYTIAKQYDDKKNIVIESSFTQSSGYFSVLYNRCGSILFSSINVSDSSLMFNAALTSEDPYRSSTTNFSNFDNTTSNQGCFNYEYGTQHFYFCNVIGNKVEEIFRCKYGALLVDRSFFKGNRAKNLFNDYYGDIRSRSLSECHFELNYRLTINANNQNSKSMTELILTNLYSSFLCEVPKLLIMDLRTKGFKMYRMNRRR